MQTRRIDILRQLGAALAVAGLLAAPAASGAQETPPQAESAAGEAEDQSFPAVAYVNSQLVVQNAPGASEAQQTFSQEVEQAQQEVRDLQARLDSLTEAYQRQEATLSEQARQQRQARIRELQQELQQRAQELDDNLSQRQQELLQPIYEKVRGVIEEIRAERGYALVFDVSGPGVVAADPTLNITDEVLDRLREQSPGDTATASPTGGEGGRR